MTVDVQCHAPAALLPAKKPGTHFTEGWGDPGPVRTGAENLAPTGIRSPNCPARSESLYRLSYRGPRMSDTRLIKFTIILHTMHKQIY